MLIISYHLVGCLTRNDRFGFMFLKNLERSKTYEEVRTAQGRTPSIINSDKLFLAAMKWSPVVDGKFITVSDCI